MTELSGKKSQRKLLAFLETEVDSLCRKNKLGLAENYRYSGHSFRGFLTTLHMNDIPLTKVSEEILAGHKLMQIRNSTPKLHKKTIRTSGGMRKIHSFNILKLKQQEMQV